VTKQPATRDPEDPFLNFGMRGSVLIPGPLYHNGPFMWATGGLFKGNTVTITTRFDAEQTLQLIEAQRVDTIYMVPTMMQRVWNLPEDVRLKYDVSSLKTLWHLAAPCPAWLKEAYIEWLGAEVIWELYGGTEGQGGTVITGPEWLAHRGSVGKPNETCEMKIVDEQGNTLPAGESAKCSCDRRRDRAPRTDTSAPKRNRWTADGRASVTWARWMPMAICISPTARPT
jgi:bile acid-coenzyme A ligase